MKILLWYLAVGVSLASLATYNGANIAQTISVCFWPQA